MIFILMGVSGTGKTTIGLKLSGEIGWPFYDADDFHPPENLRKLSRGQLLTDADRRPWLAELRKLIKATLQRGENAVLACSAIRESDRQVLTVDPERIRFIHLKGTQELIRLRLRYRSGRFVKDDLLANQFAILEEPKQALTVDIDDRPGRLVEQIRRAFDL
jgi:gluconokinase